MAARSQQTCIARRFGFVGCGIGRTPNTSQQQRRTLASCNGIRAGIGRLHGRMVRVIHAAGERCRRCSQPLSMCLERGHQEDCQGVLCEYPREHNTQKSEVQHRHAVGAQSLACGESRSARCGRDLSKPHAHFVWRALPSETACAACMVLASSRQADYTFASSARRGREEFAKLQGEALRVTMMGFGFNCILAAVQGSVGWCPSPTPGCASGRLAWLGRSWFGVGVVVCVLPRGWGILQCFPAGRLDRRCRRRCCHSSGEISWRGMLRRPGKYSGHKRALPTRDSQGPREKLRERHNAHILFDTADAPQVITVGG